MLSLTQIIVGLVAGGVGLLILIGFIAAILFVRYQIIKDAAEQEYVPSLISNA
jgi:hypothetical protein